jgi:hypothetical protein
VDLLTGDEFDQACGKCDRETNCSYFYTPHQFMIDNGIGGERSNPMRRDIPVQAPKRTDWRCPAKVVELTNDHRGNTFAKWLVHLLGERARVALRKYKCGTYPVGKKRPELASNMIWWQIGVDGLHRSGKIMPYDDTGHRIKDQPTEWIHSVVYNKSMAELGIGQVLFGSHLLAERPDAECCIVESEKSAVIASCFWPDKIWLATGGSHGLSAESCMCLAGRKVWLFPDSGVYHEWCNKATQIGLDVLASELIVSDILEAEGREVGSDIADYLVPVRTLTDPFALPEEPSCKIAFLPDGRPIGHSFKPSVTTPDIPSYVVGSYTVEPKPIQSPIDRLVASNPAIGKLVEELGLDMNAATVKPLKS